MCIYIDGDTGPCPKAALHCWFLPGLTSPPFLANKCLNLPIGTPEGCWGMNEGCFLESKKWGTQKGFVPRTPAGPGLVSRGPLWTQLQASPPHHPLLPRASGQPVVKSTECEAHGHSRHAKLLLCPACGIIVFSGRADLLARCRSQLCNFYKGNTKGLSQ